MALARKRILLTTFGSLGDLHPMLALARGLQARGAHVTVASSELHGPRVEAAGLAFARMRPNVTPEDAVLTRRLLNRRSGAEVLVRELMMQPLRQTYADLERIARGMDLLIAGEVVYAAPLVAERLKLPWVSVLLSPFALLSAVDPAVFPNLPWPEVWRAAPAGVQRLLLRLARAKTRGWFDEVDRLRAELALSPSKHPLFDDKFAAKLTLALFSPALARAQSDWPPAVLPTGFVWYDGVPLAAAQLEALDAFFEAGEAPIVVTLGSAAVFDAGGFYEHTLQAAQRLGRRALILAGANALRVPADDLAARRVAVLDYAPHSLVFPRAACVVHQGGVGTTGQALRAGRPQLVVPFAFDQPDNASRVARLGCGRVLPRHRFSARRARRALEQVLADASMDARAAQIGRQVAAEQGLENAIRAIESRIAPLSAPREPHE